MGGGRGGSPNTNTTAFNGIEGVLDMFAVPAAGIALSSVPGGPLFRAAAGYGLMRHTGNTTSAMAQDLVGPKGTGIGGVPPAGSANAGGAPGWRPTRAIRATPLAWKPTHQRRPVATAMAEAVSLWPVG